MFGFPGFPPRFEPYGFSRKAGFWFVLYNHTKRALISNLEDWEELTSNDIADAFKQMQQQFGSEEVGFRGTPRIQNNPGNH